MHFRFDGERGINLSRGSSGFQLRLNHHTAYRDLNPGVGDLLLMGHVLLSSRASCKNSRGNLACCQSEIKASHLLCSGWFMLESTFLFLPGIGHATERRLWNQGIVDWHNFLARSVIPGISSARKHWYDGLILEALAYVASGSWRTLGQQFPPSEHWRLFNHLRPRTAFLDIETTGASRGRGHITVVGIWSQWGLTQLVWGETLTPARLAEEFARYDLLVTFGGSRFDLPYLRIAFPTVPWDHAHFDLCLAARRVGLSGGLKSIERTMGIERDPQIRDLNGWDAVWLWRRWIFRRDRTAYTRLLAYNAADVRHLQPLAEWLYAQLAARSGPQSDAGQHSRVHTRSSEQSRSR
ncbi:MAG: hypothetical protein D6704_12010 [Nitrospirae bacterium]|nr:MAG: hypothetical protein D6704_12010 [Nitrospirota bacterium]